MGISVNREKPIIYFRADANSHVGNGHIMRCLTIADACMEQGMQPVFLLADDTPQALVREREYETHVFATDYRDMESELPLYEKVAEPGAVILADSYFLTMNYMEQLQRRGYHVAWMDDLGEQSYPADYLINYNLYAEELDYRKRTQAGIRYLLGASYAPVRPVFIRNVYRVKQTVQKILITTGASDPYHAGYLFAEALLNDDPDWQVTVICGAYNTDVPKLLKLSEEYGNRLQVMEHLTDLSDVMYESDLAIAAAGSTLYELCAVGVPALVYEFADNQHQGAEAFSKRTGRRCLGDLRLQPKEAAKTACEEAKKLKDHAERKRISIKMQELSDGHGAERIAERLKTLTSMHRNEDENDRTGYAKRKNG